MVISPKIKMFRAQVSKNNVGRVVNIAELIYHTTVRQLRKSHGNAMVGLITNMLQATILVAVFYVMFSILGLRSSALRGDFLLYIMSGIFLYLTHTKAVAAVVGAEGPASPIMQHAPMNTVISICSAALAVLYIQVLSLAVILTIYYSVKTHFEIMNPVAAMAMLLLAWFSGVAVGLVFLALKPWFPGFVNIATTIYMRANMIASGKMFLANTLNAKILALFSWNPLFHCIDQSRGFTFINYNPHNSSIIYPVFLSLALMMIGLMGEFFTRKHASISWNARR